MLERLELFILGWGANEPVAHAATRLIAFVVVLILSLVVFFIASRIVLGIIERIALKTKAQWDDKIVRSRAHFWAAHLAPAIVIYLLASTALGGWDTAIEIVLGATQIYMIVVALLALDALLDAALAIYNDFPVSREIPLKGFVQVAKLILYILAAIVVISTLLSKSPIYLLSGMGVLASVLILIFKDAILGFVAGIQLSANRMLAKGDWIEMPKYGADGDVLEVALTTVKVQNWDKTITTIPTYALITDSFKNWRGMSESGGRRIKRSIYVDLNTIKRCTPEMLERFKRIKYIAAYVEEKSQELARWNQERGIDMLDVANARHLTNVGTFRAYIQSYLENHPQVNPDMTLLVRHLEAMAQGLPIQIYCFCRDKAWANYERIQADIFDHILAIAPEFDLRIFQNPTGSDFRALSDARVYRTE